MKRIRTQSDFITRAHEIYGNTYDYSLVQYVNSSTPVKIICPIHGTFEKTPNKHLQGQGCPVCGRNRTKLGVGKFVERARKIHGDKYDYSQVVYNRIDEPVEIVCPMHGVFLQTPHDHVTLKHNCPKCGHAQAGQKRKGVKNVAHRQDVKVAKATTCLGRYGTSTWAESSQGRQRLHEIIVDEGGLDKMKETCQIRYGTDFWTQSEEGRAVLQQRMASEEVRSKIVAGYKAVYGMHYMQTKEGREKARHYIDDERREKMLQSLTEKYGVPYVVFTEAERQEIVKKSWQTKRKHGTFNTSQPEVTLYKLLCDTFGSDDVETQYVDNERYPFHCDFYVKSQDLFIELNAHWSHGGHWFDVNSPEDIKLLEHWQTKAANKGSGYYHAAIQTWTVRDLLKLQFAIDNELNYVVFWKNDLSDAREYLSSEVVLDETVK